MTLRASPPKTDADGANAARSAICRHCFGTEMRKLREAVPLRIEDLAATLGVATSTVSRIENGLAPARTSYVNVMLDMYGVDDPDCRRELADLAREGRHKGWRADYDALLPAVAATFLGLESAASLVRSFAALAVPDLAQTREYAAALSRITCPPCNGYRASPARRTHDAPAATCTQQRGPAPSPDNRRVSTGQAGRLGASHGTSASPAGGHDRRFVADNPGRAPSPAAFDPDVVLYRAELRRTDRARCRLPWRYAHRDRPHQTSQRRDRANQRLRRALSDGVAARRFRRPDQAPCDCAGNWPGNMTRNATVSGRWLRQRCRCLMSQAMLAA